MGDRRPRGIYVLPNLFTTAAMFCGFYAILCATSERYSMSAVLIFVAMVFDGMDGRVARWTNTTSDFGVQYDSLSDLTSFGIAPALLMYLWGLHHLNGYDWVPVRLTWLASFLFAACAALRLARFNVQSVSIDKAFFRGLPSPAAAAGIAAFVWAGEEFAWHMRYLPIAALVLIVSLALLMVSNFNYYSFKTYQSNGRIVFSRTIIPVLTLGLIFLEPSLSFLVIFLVYAAHGPVWAIGRYYARRRQKTRSVE